MDTNSKYSYADGKLFAEGRIVVDFVPILKSKRVILDRGKKKFSYKIEILHPDRKPDIVEVPDFHIKSWHDICGNCADASLSSIQRKRIREFLEVQEAGMKEEQYFAISGKGWRNIGEGKVFSNGKTIITYGIPPNVICADKGVPVIAAEEYCPDIQRWESVLAAVRDAAPGVSMPLFMMSMYDVLKGIFMDAGYPIEYICNLYGESGKGKSSLARTVCSFAKALEFDERKSTIKNVLEECEGCNVLVDDFHPRKEAYKKERQSGIKDMLVRFVEKDTSAPNIIITSEYLDGYYSTQDREVQLFLEREVNWEKLTFLQNNKIFMDHIRTAFQVEVVKNVKEIRKFVRDFCFHEDCVRNEAGSDGKRGHRYSRYLCCVNEIFNRFFLEKYQLSFLAENIDEALMLQNQRQSAHMEIIRKIEKYNSYVIAVWHMIRSEILHIEHDLRHFRPSDDNICISGNDEIAVSHGALLNGMCIYLRTKNLNMKDVIRDLKNADLILTYNSKGNRDLTKISHNQHYYHIDGYRLERHCKILEGIE